MEKWILIIAVFLTSCLSQQGIKTFEFKEAEWIHEYNNMHYVSVTLNGMYANLLIDTGASKSLLDINQALEYEFAYQILPKKQYVGMGGIVNIYLVYDYTVDEYFIPFLGADLSDITDYFMKDGINIVGILGIDFLEMHRIVIDFDMNVMYKKQNIIGK